jgi:hypothetical protein
MNESTPEQSQISRARAAGAFWLITFITGCFAMYMGGSLVVNGNAAATAANVLSNETAFRIGVAGNLVATISYLLATILVYNLFKQINSTLSLATAVFSLLGCAAGVVVSLFNFAPLALLKGSPYLGAFTNEQLQALALTSFSLGMRANEIGLVFFGLHIGIVGYLIVTSALVPRLLGVLLMIGGLCYETESFASFLAAAFAKNLFPVILLPAFFAELVLTVWLLAKGVRTQLPNAAPSLAPSRLLPI